MRPGQVSERSPDLPPRPWVIAGGGQPCLLNARGMTLLPVFRTAEACRDFLRDHAGGTPGHIYPQFPDAAAFVRLLAAAMHAGAGGYALVDAGQVSVIPFARSPAVRPASAPALVPQPHA